MLIKLLVYGSVIYVFVWVGYCSISDKFHVVPLALDNAPLEISQFPLTWEFLRKKWALVLTIGLDVRHFALNSYTILILTLKYVTIIVLNLDLAV